MVDGWIFLYVAPAAVGALTFLKVVSNQVKVIDSSVRVRAQELEIAAAKVRLEESAGGE